jgi:hypothetical protein
LRSHEDTATNQVSQSMLREVRSLRPTLCYRINPIGDFRNDTPSVREKFAGKAGSTVARVADSDLHAAAHDKNEAMSAAPLKYLGPAVS